MAWRAAKSLTKFHAQLKEAVPAAKPPATDVNAWGIVGDQDHSNTSDHSPHNFAGWANDVVTAADAPHAPALGLDYGHVAESLRLSRDPRIKYVIYNRRIFSGHQVGNVAPFVWRSYAGSDPHNTHGHLSVVGDARADGEQPWAIGYGVKNSMADYDLANDPHGRPALFRLEAVMKMTDPANIHNAGFPGWGDAVESNELAKILRKIDVQGAANALALTSLHAKIDALTAKVNSLVAPTPGGQPFTPAQLAQIQGVVEAAEDS